MATIGAVELADNNAVQLFTFGSPRVGNAAFAAWANARLSPNNLALSIRMRRQLDIVPALPPREIGYEHLSTEVWNKHAGGMPDTYVVCDGSGEDPACGDSEEHPEFPFDLLHLKPEEHTRYMGYGGGSCVGGPHD